MPAVARARARDDDAAQAEDFGRDGALVGKAAAIADWRFRKEQRDFNKLVATLRAVKWNKEHAEQHKAHTRAYAKAHQAEYLAYQKRRRRAAHRRRGEVFTCQECGAQWCPVPWARGKVGRGRFCDEPCYSRWYYRERGRALYLAKRAKRAP